MPPFFVIIRHELILNGPENCVFLGYCSASSGNFLLTFLDPSHFQGSRFQKIPRMIPINCTETSVRNYHFSLLNNTEECNFFVFCWPCISLQILGNNQLDALFYVFIYFISLRVSSVTELIIRRSNCINASSGMVSLCKWLLGMPASNHTRWCINTIRSPDDERCDARNM